MSVTTIEIPVTHLAAVHESLLRARRRLVEEPSGVGGSTARDRRSPGSSSEELGELDALLEQVASADGSRSEPCEVTGSRVVLWSAVYDAVCGAAERLADDCNEYWTGLVDPSRVRAGVADLDGRFHLLETLGAPPGELRQDV